MAVIGLDFDVDRSDEAVSFRPGHRSVRAHVGFLVFALAMFALVLSGSDGGPGVVLVIGGLVVLAAAGMIAAVRWRVVLDADGVTLVGWRRRLVPWNEVASLGTRFGAANHRRPADRSRPARWTSSETRPELRTWQGERVAMPFGIGMSSLGREVEAVAEFNRIFRAAAERLRGTSLEVRPVDWNPRP